MRSATAWCTLFRGLRRLSRHPMLYVFGTRRLGSVCARVQRLCRRAAAPQRTAHKLGFTVRRNPAPRAPPSQSNLKPSAAAPAMKVLVVGAGFAGLAAARRLQAKGWDVCILEGSHRVGGRAQTTELPGCGQVEMGATWLHGLEGNPLYAYAVEHGLMSSAAKQKDEAWGSSKWVREGASEPLSDSEVHSAKTAAGAFSMAVEESMLADSPGVTVGHCLRSAWPKARDRFQASEQQLAAETWAWRHALQCSMDGCTHTDDMLASGLAEYDELDELNVPVPNGFQSLARHMAKELDIHFGAVVTSISWSETRASATCADGRTLSCDALIWTASLGVLKHSHEGMFTPPLPPEKAAVIRRMGFGVINKVFISSPASHSPQAPRSKACAFSLLWSLPSFDSWADKPVRQPGEAEWLRGAYALRMRGSEFVRFDEGHRAAAATAHPADGPDPDSASEAGSSSPGGQHNAATAWIAGPEALAMERRTDAELAADVAVLLNSFPAARSQLPAAERVVRSRWGTDPLTRGSYSYIAAASGVDDVAALGAPVPAVGRPVLLFAGEATHASHFGTAHGAFISGEREADRLLSIKA